MESQISLSTKILLVIASFVILCVGGFIIYKQFETSKKLEDIQHSFIEQKQLLDNISRAQAQYASKEDIEAYAKQQNINLDVIRKDLDGLGAQVQAINGITIISRGQTGNNIPSTSVTPNPNPIPSPPGVDPYGYLNNTQHLALNEKFSNVEVPFGTVGFSAWKDKPWDLNVPERKYSITSVLGQDANGRHYSYSKMSIKSGDKIYDVKIDDNKFIEEYPESKFSFFNPKLHLTAGGGVNVSNAPLSGSANIGVTLGIMSYGKIKTAPSISILQVGAGYQTASQRPSVIVNPVSFNLGNIFPTNLVQNTYVGPSAQVDTAGTVYVGGNVSVGF